MEFPFEESINWERTKIRDCLGDNLSTELALL